METNTDTRGKMYLHRLLLAIFMVGSVAVLLELALLGHFEDVLQFIPLVLIGLGIASAAWYARSTSMAAAKAFRWTLILFVVAGIAGLYLHYRGNVEFERERAPELSGLPLFWEAITGATPALSPGAMVLFAAIGYAAMAADGREAEPPRTL